MTKSRRAYPTDLNDTQWHVIAPLLPLPAKTGRPREHPWREIVNAIFYITASGCAWRLLPHEFPPWKTVYTYFRKWRLDGSRERWNAALREAVRLKAKRDRQPSAAILDSQSVKTVEGGTERGYDAGKKVTGRKRHLVVDTLGLVLLVLVTAANVQDREGARLYSTSAWIEFQPGKWCALTFNSSALAKVTGRSGSAVPVSRIAGAIRLPGLNVETADYVRVRSGPGPENAEAAPMFNPGSKFVAGQIFAARAWIEIGKERWVALTFDGTQFLKFL